jgi:hypothetical protein
MEKVKNTNEAVSAGAQLAAQRKKYIKECVVCGQEFEGTFTAVTCSDRCRKRKSRNGKKS